MTKNETFINDDVSNNNMVAKNYRRKDVEKCIQDTPRILYHSTGLMFFSDQLRTHGFYKNEIGNSDEVHLMTEPSKALERAYYKAIGNGDVPVLLITDTSRLAYDLKTSVDSWKVESLNCDAFLDYIPWINKGRLSDKNEEKIAKRVKELLSGKTFIDQFQKENKK